MGALAKALDEPGLSVAIFCDVDANQQAVAQAGRARYGFARRRREANSWHICASSRGANEKIAVRIAVYDITTTATGSASRSATAVFGRLGAVRSASRAGFSARRPGPGFGLGFGP